MKRGAMWFVGGALAVAVLATAVALPGLSAGNPSASGLPEVCRNDPSGKTTKIATAKLIIEYNSTDNDVGVHGAFDNHGWSELCVFDPSGRPIAAVDPLSQLNDLTMAGIFFESREPPAEEFSLADLQADFPEGHYEVRGRSFDGMTLVGSAWFTHNVPTPPTITTPAIADGPRGAARNPVSRNGLAVGWDRVTETVDGGPVAITGYEVIITKEVKDDPHGFSRPIYDVHVPASLNSLSVPAEFLEADTVYELEVLALEESGNQTISVGFFKTA
jgi:hypothetical protein